MTKPTRTAGDATPLRLLLVEDEERDAWLIVRVLQRNGFAVTWERVDTAAALAAAIERAWDVVTCDWRMPRLAAEEALAIIAARRPELAVVAVSGEAGDEVAKRALQAGVRHVVGKDQLSLLAPVVEAIVAEGSSQARR